MTYGECQHWGRAALVAAKAGNALSEELRDIRQEAAFESRLLLSWATGKTAAWLLAHADETTANEAVERFREAIQRRTKAEPVAHILGEAGFHGRMFTVTPDVLVPRPDTELLVDIASDWLLRQGGRPDARTDARFQGALAPDHPMRLLDVGTGSGCIPISLLAAFPELQAVAMDISPAALAVARCNAERHGVAARMTFLEVDVLRLPKCAPEADANHLSKDAPKPDVLRLPMDAPAAKTESPSPPDLFAALAPPFDLLLSNPPYIPSADVPELMPDVRVYEPALALDGGADGLIFYRHLVACAPCRLRPGGLLAVEIGYDQGAEVARLFREAGFEPTVAQDLEGRDRVVWACRPAT